MSWRETLITSDDTILRAIKCIDSTPFRIALVVAKDMRLLGTVTDGDIRRGLLRNVPTGAPVSQVMNATPRTARLDEPWEDVVARLAPMLLRQVPIIDNGGILHDLKTIEESDVVSGHRDNWVVLMAGGEGRRLRPLTNTTPKPMLRVGNRSIIETIMTSFTAQGFHRFYVSVHYRAAELRAHLGDGSRLGAEIRYLEEDQAMGTAGALALIPETHTDPLVVMNADLLTNLNFENLIDYHAEHGADATMCIREYDFQVPFGVAQFDSHHRVQRIEEKPVYKFFVNAGIYAVNPDLPCRIRGDEAVDMPDFLETVVEQGGNVVAFPIREYWIDVGNLDNLEKANAQFDIVFGTDGDSGLQIEEPDDQ